MSTQADRFRVSMKALVERGVTDMSRDAKGITFAMMVKPFLPMVYPMIANMPDETALSIFEHIEKLVTYIRTGRPNAASSQLHP